MNRVVRYENTTAPGRPADVHRPRPAAHRGGRAVVGRLSLRRLGRRRAHRRAGGLGRPGGAAPQPGRRAGRGAMRVADGAYVEAERRAAPARAGARWRRPTSTATATSTWWRAEVDGRLFWFENVGTRTAPLLTVGRMLAYHGYMDAYLGVKVADFDGDGRLDIVAGRAWERTPVRREPRVFGRLFATWARATAPRFEARDAAAAARPTWSACSRPTRCARTACARSTGTGTAGPTSGRRQRRVRALLPQPGRRRARSSRRPMRLRPAARPSRCGARRPEGRAAGYARAGRGRLERRRPCRPAGGGRAGLADAVPRTWARAGSRACPRAAPAAAGLPIDGTSRGSVLVVDWDGDGRKDVLFAMVGEGPTLTTPGRTSTTTTLARPRRALLPQRGHGGRAAAGRAALGERGPEGSRSTWSARTWATWSTGTATGGATCVCEFETSCRVFLNTGEKGEAAAVPLVGRRARAAAALDRADHLRRRRVRLGRRRPRGRAHRPGPRRQRPALLRARLPGGRRAGHPAAGKVGHSCSEPALSSTSASCT